MTFTIPADGPLAFPITPLRTDLSIDLSRFEEHVAWMVGQGAPALFVACGTGEFASLTASEIGELASVAVGASDGAPVYVGAGQTLPTAVACARYAQDAGAAGLLLFPPYLREFDAAGLVGYVRAVAGSTALPIVLYQRDGIAFEPEVLGKLLDLPNIVGLKDGLGDVERMQRIVHSVGDRLAYFNGMPTAETYQPSYAAAGVPHYSSAVYNFVPEVSWAFWRAQHNGDGDQVAKLIQSFFVPLAELRRKVKGYAIALVKAGVTIRRGYSGTVRPPLVEATAELRRQLETLIVHALEIVEPGAMKATPY